MPEVVIRLPESKVEVFHSPGDYVKANLLFVHEKAKFPFPHTITIRFESKCKPIQTAVLFINLDVMTDLINQFQEIQAKLREMEA